ncbi:hypothetical protein LAZ67_3000200 [Cordylochernes scorpioides]|uniref:Uncharacterized protein n=1 Tax=Cordylochernes scorpioides TaxID=51811 RepID=A0ABY6K6U1_9ARAC|nr:hypothetical protein LAZ67_3000200 [Cordylochernes scorpioides]
MEYKRYSSCIPGSGALTGYYQPGQMSPGFLIKVELGAKDGDRIFLTDYKVNEEDLGDNRRELALRVN